MNYLDKNSSIVQAGALKEIKVRELSVGSGSNNTISTFSFGTGVFEVRGWGAGSTEYSTTYHYTIFNNTVFLTIDAISQNMLNTGGTGELYYAGFYNTIIPAIRPLKSQSIPIRVLKAGSAFTGRVFIQGSQDGTSTPISIYKDLDSTGFARDGASAGWGQFTVVYYLL